VQSLVDSFDWGDLEDGPQDAVNKGMQANIAGEEMKEFCREVLQLAQKGLEGRKLGEEKLLIPLWESLDTATCPADHAREIFSKQGLKAFLESHSTTRVLDEAK
jgi:gamma-glutamylcysteine synthetase